MDADFLTFEAKNLSRICKKQVPDVTELSLYITTSSRWILFGEIIAVCWENYTKHKNMIGGKHKHFDVEPGGTEGNHFVLRGWK